MSALGHIFSSSTIRFSALVCTAAVGGFMTWAAVAPLAEGVVAYGQVSVENNRKTIQHLEGGIIQEIMVAEGDRVSEGQSLIVLTDTAVSSGRDQVVFELAAALAAVDRLTALADGEDQVSFEAMEQTVADTDLDVADLRRRQEDLFHQQKRSHEANIEVLRRRRESLLNRADSFGAQLDENARSIGLVVAEVERNRELLTRQLIRASDLANLEREEAQLRTERSRLESELTLARDRADEAAREISLAEAAFQEGVSEELVEARGRVLSLGEQLEAAQDVVNRTVIHAPQAGEVMNLRFTTSGGVVRPGEPILEIVPAESSLIAVVQIRPVDREAVFEGLSVDARLSGSDSWRPALYGGVVDGISADLKTSPDGSANFYEARITLSEARPGAAELKPLPGMPVEAFVYSGQRRTFLDYLIEPLAATLRRGARE